MSKESLTYSEFLILVKQIEDYYELKSDLELMRQENDKLKRENFGLKQRIINLEEKLYKRDEDFKGEVHDCYIKKRRRNK